jgi:tRNA pseudouridine55 synthase
MTLGLLNIHKPAGLTSRDVVNRVERLVRPARAGHAGTLDPIATGVLVVCIGGATRLIERVQQMPKSYAATFELGITSPTEDIEGEVTPLEAAPIPSLEDLRAAARELTGEIDQRPPAFSALKVEGRRAYSLARAGAAVELKPRRISVHRFEIVDYHYPHVRTQIDCGSGTYIRSLGRDLAERVGTSAVMTELVRTAIGSFRLDDAVPLAALSRASLGEHLLSAQAAVPDLPLVTLDETQLARVANGQFVTLAIDTAHNELAALDSSGQLASLLARREGSLWGPRYNFAHR